jgi:hypothetical protein
MLYAQPLHRFQISQPDIHQMRRNTRRQEANERLAARLDEAEQALQSELGLLWRIHVLSYLMIRRVQADPSLHSGLSLIAWRIVITLASVPGLSANEIVLLWGLEKMGVNRPSRSS